MQILVCVGKEHEHPIYIGISMFLSTLGAESVLISASPAATFDAVSQLHTTMTSTPQEPCEKTLANTFRTPTNPEPNRDISAWPLFVFGLNERRLMLSPWRSLGVAPPQLLKLPAFTAPEAAGTL